ncbi:hypothetical protein E2C01_000760 [Portunus trituberculatus]|uniref:Uncharacterized protein n=1 Tax=Portunus trituberculatus TaxID=210409 RepID=A0A5B7CKT8_PORTR|nr:hypothetical protein [Portunus trituberculatus]
MKSEKLGGRVSEAKGRPRKYWGGDGWRGALMPSPDWSGLERSGRQGDGGTNGKGGKEFVRL